MACTEEEGEEEGVEEDEEEVIGDMEDEEVSDNSIRLILTCP